MREGSGDLWGRRLSKEGWKDQKRSFFLVSLLSLETCNVRIIYYNTTIPLIPDQIRYSYIAGGVYGDFQPRRQIQLVVVSTTSYLSYVPPSPEKFSPTFHPHGRATRHLLFHLIVRLRSWSQNPTSRDPAFI